MNNAFAMAMQETHEANEGRRCPRDIHVCLTDHCDSCDSIHSPKNCCTLCEWITCQSNDTKIMRCAITGIVMKCGGDNRSRVSAGTEDSRKEKGAVACCEPRHGQVERGGLGVREGMHARE